MEEVENNSSDFVGSDPSFFVEKKQVLEWLQSLCSEEIPGRREQLLDTLEKALIKYQEQPQLLGPHIESLMEPVNSILVELLLRSENLGEKVSRKSHRAFQKVYVHILNNCISNPFYQDNLLLFHVCKFVQLLCRIRGFKQVAKHLPHEVYQLEPCCLLLTKQVRHHPTPFITVSS